jgi:crotonobetainyl-CoA:carnitine CoA-transferase CaiB-like acyl-CoA transferase
MAVNGRRHVLDGYRALDFTQFVAGPTVTKLMAEMGAEVIKFELAPDGDRSRAMPFVKNERSGYFVQQNRDKLSLCLDPRSEDGKTIIRDLITKVDVVVENFAPGVIARMGFDYETVCGINPKIITCSVSTFGQQGPLANDPGYDFVGQAYAGVTSLSGEEGGAHFPPMLAIGDVSTECMDLLRSLVLYCIANAPTRVSISIFPWWTPTSVTTTSGCNRLAPAAARLCRSAPGCTIRF